MVHEANIGSKLDYNFIVTDQPSKEDCAAVLNVLRKFTTEQVETLDNNDFAVFVVDADRRVLGGITAQSRWGGFQIDVIALDERLRKRGYGTRLMQFAEQEALRRECHHMLLDTYEFQAKEFYLRHGFVVFGQLEGPAPFYPRYFMQKPLNQ